jgi:hypothetical protein
LRAVNALAGARETAGINDRHETAKQVEIKHERTHLNIK